MRVLYVIQRYAPFIGGAELVFQENGERLAHAGHAVTVYTTDAWDLERFWRDDKGRVDVQSETLNEVFIERFPVEYLPLSRLTFPGIKRVMGIISELPFDSKGLLFALSRYVPYVPELDAMLDTSSERFDIVHTANISLDSSVYAAYRFAKRKNIPFVITPFLHLGEREDTRVVKYYTLPHQIEMLKRADAVVVMTEREGNALVERGVARDRIHRIGAGVDPDALAGGDSAQFRRTHDISTPIVAYIGTAAFDKGTTHLVEAMQKVWETQDATLVLAGAQLTAFQDYISALPETVKQRIVQLGFISEQEKKDLLAACDVFAMPSRTDSFGIVYLEAWLYEKPVVGADAGGVPDVIDANKNGFLVKFGDVNALAARITQLISDRALGRRLGENGRAKVLRELTWEGQHAKLCTLYEQLTR